MSTRIDTTSLATSELMQYENSTKKCSNYLKLEEVKEKSTNVSDHSQETPTQSKEQELDLIIQDVSN